MKDQPLPERISMSGATITLVTATKAAVDPCAPCAPCEECRPVCEEGALPDCAPDCTCDPVCMDEGKEPAPEPEQLPDGESQECEPNT